VNGDSKDKYLCNTLSNNFTCLIQKSGHDCPLFVWLLYHLKTEKSFGQLFTKLSSY